MKAWKGPEGVWFEALSRVHGHVYTVESKIGLEEIDGDTLRLVPGGEGYADSRKVFLHAYDDQRMIATTRDGLLTLYDGQKVVPFPTAQDEYLKAKTI